MSKNFDKTKLLFLAIVFFTMVCYSNSEELVLTLDQCIKIAQEKSHQAKIIKSTYQGSKYDYDAFLASFYPQLQFNSSLPGLFRSINRITQPDGSEEFLPQSQLYSNWDLGISQKIPWTGGNFSVSSNLTRIDQFGDNDIFYWRSSPVVLTLQQPLFQYNSMKWDRILQEKVNIYSDKKYNEDMEDLAISITQKFFDLFIAKMTLINADDNLAINDTLFNIAKGRYKVGKIGENDLLQSELSLMNFQSRYESILLNFERMKENLILALGLETDTKIEIVAPDILNNIKIDINEALREAKIYRSDITNYEIEKTQSDMNLNRTENMNDFQANIIASFGMNQTAGQIPDAYRNLLDQESFNLTFQLPLYQWGLYDSQVQSAKEEQYRSIKSIELKSKEFELSVKFQVLEFLQLQQQVILSSKADTIAQKRFEVAKNRYMIGKIDQNSLFIAQQEKNSAFQSYIQTVRNFWLAYYGMRRVTMYDFIKGKPIIY